MDAVVYTPRLKLTLVTKVESGSDEFEWFHGLFSDKQSTWWSIYGQSKSIEDTKTRLSYIVPSKPTEPERKSYRVLYAVHRILDAPSTTDASYQPKQTSRNDRPAEFVGSINLKSLDETSLHLSELYVVPDSEANTTLILELAYMFLPSAWGHGYATEAIAAMFGACQRAPDFWYPYSKLYARGIVNPTNQASLRVMDKIGMSMKGVYEWRGKAVFLAGDWREQESLHIRGRYLLA